MYGAYIMQRTQIYLSEQERQGLQALALSRGSSQSALIREAIDAYLQLHQPQHRLARLRQARGLWANRSDLPDWMALRRELDRPLAPEQ
jgi:predicted transcriptional regulator